MLLFLQGEDSKERFEFLKTGLEKRYKGKEILHLDSGEPKSARYLMSLLGQYSGFLGDEDNEFILVLTSPDKWLLNDPSITILFETLGGVVFTDDSYAFGTIKEREKYPSFMKERYTSFPQDDLDEYTRLIGTHLEYAHDRAKAIHGIVGEGYYGEVTGSPRTIFVSEYAHDDEDGLFRQDVSFVLMIKEQLIDEHANHVGVVSLDKVSDLQEVFPFSGYVALGSRAYEFIQKYVDEDIVKAGVPSPSGIKDWTNQESIVKKFARLVSNVVESGERKTSYLQL